MAVDPKSPAGGGCFILLGFLAGAAIGIATGQASQGAILGALAGIALAVIVWMVGRSRGR